MILFILIIVIIYLIAAKVNVVHADNLPEEQKRELNKRSEVKSLLLNGHLKESFYPQRNETPETGTNFQLYNPSDINDYRPNMEKLIKALPNASNLIQLIISEYVDRQYKFNEPNLPVTFRYPSDRKKPVDRKYLELIRKDINSWNLLFEKYFSVNKQFIKVENIKLISAEETEVEFVLNVNAKLSYLGKSLHLTLGYYGQVIRSDDFLGGAPPVQYIIQLFNVIPLKKHEFEAKVEFKSDPFLNMSDQLAYVERISYMHKNENNL